MRNQIPSGRRRFQESILAGVAIASLWFAPAASAATPTHLAVGRSRLATRLGLLGLLFAVIGCVTPGASPADSNPPAPSTAAAANTLEPTPTPAASPTPADAAPAELIGTWEAKLAGGDTVKLTFTELGYRVGRVGYGPGNRGRISVQGDEIEFSRDNHCEGTGTYRWSLEGDVLTFTATGAADPCSGVRVHAGQTYQRVP